MMSRRDDSGGGSGGDGGTSQPSVRAEINNTLKMEAEAELAGYERALQLMGEEQEGVGMELRQMAEEIAAENDRRQREPGTHQEAMEKLELKQRDQVCAEDMYGILATWA